MKRIVVASHNPVKIQATLAGFQMMFPDETFTVDGVSVDSGVSDQPGSDQEALEGARNRAVNASALKPDADFWVGMESGIDMIDGDMQTSAWVVVRSADGRMGKSRSMALFLPPKVAELVRQGKELGEADDIVFGRVNSKQANGAPGLLTHDVITRTDVYQETVVLALVPFKNPDLYPLSAPQEAASY